MVDLSDVPALKRLNVNVEQPCEQWPSLESNESYTLVVEKGHATLNSVSIWGALRGLETFSQLVYPDEDLLFAINETIIYDFPRFQHRGFLLDTGTHFISLKRLKMNLVSKFDEAMAQSKMNVFHFHIVDDQSFPYDSITYPGLSGRGAFDLNHIYSQADITELLEFARQRGIRVFIEFDSPAHSRSWGRAYDILTKCYSGEQPNHKQGPMDPSRNTTFEFLKNFFYEVAQIFPDRYVHLGADEVYFDCWYLNYISYGEDWHKYYMCDPLNFTEFVDSTNVISTTWPRASAAAERLWSSADVNDVKEAIPRLEEHRCRYLRRGIPAAPVNGPSYCRTEYND
ncbi:unnamed protein product [Rotaria sp. Silwood2]|nr:unnamed protein product [Rotaria sp. Silwood2]